MPMLNPPMRANLDMEQNLLSNSVDMLICILRFVIHFNCIRRYVVAVNLRKTCIDICSDLHYHMRR